MFGWSLRRTNLQMPRSATAEYNKTPRSLGRASRTGVFWTTARAYIVEIVTLPATIALAQMLSPFDFGVAAVATFFGRLAARVSNAGMGSALVRVKVLREEHISSIFVVNLIICAAAALMLLVAARPLATFYREPRIAALIPFVALDFVFSALSMVPQALLTRAMRYKDIATLGAADAITAAAASVVFASMGFGYWSIVFGPLCGSVVKWGWGIKLIGLQMSFRFVPAAARELLSFAAGTYSRGLLEYVALNIDNLVIGRVLGVTPLGYYDKAFSTTQRAYNKLTLGGPGVSFRALAIMQDDPVRFCRAFEKIVVSATLLTYGTFAVLGVMGPHFIVLLFGEKWSPSVVPFQMLCVGAALRTAAAFAGSAANARGWIWRNVWLQGAYAVMIAAGIVVAAPWGANGAAAAVLAATTVMTLSMMWLVRSATNLRWRQILTPHAPGLTLALLLGGLAWTTERVLIQSGVQSHLLILAVQAAVTGLAALAALRWTPFPLVSTVLSEIVGDVSPKLAGLLAPNAGAGQSARDEERKARQRTVESDRQ
jgi:O-antigen/teichoic acid export membrane protein